MFNSRNYNKVFLATGGSGGHIFPTISIAKKLIKNNYDVCILSDDIYIKYASPNINYKIISSGKSLTSIQDIKKIFLGIYQSIKFLLKEKPNLLISFGCYATFPILLACIFTRTPFMLHEQNTYIGKVNKLFYIFAQNLMISFPELYGISSYDENKIIYTGSPMREEINQLYNNIYTYPKENEKFIVLITGGSAGAKIFSEELPKIFDIQNKNELKKFKVYHQVRQEYIDSISNYYKSIGLEAEVNSFFSNIDDLLNKSHLIIGRAGSGTIFETAIAGKLAIFIPLQSKSNNRQYDNLKLFIKNDAVKVVLENDFNVNDFQKMFFDLVKNESLLQTMSKNIKKLAVVDADQRILNVIEDFCKKNVRRK